MVLTAAVRRVTFPSGRQQGDVLWLRELLVLPMEQHHGLGRRLHNATLSGRNEAWATLTCIIDNQSAHDAYVRRGHRIIG